MNNNNASLWTKILFVLSLFTSISPIDALPDFLPILGQIDDAIAIPLTIILGIKLIMDHRRRKMNEANTENPDLHRGFNNAKYAGEDFDGESVYRRYK